MDRVLARPTSRLLNDLYAAYCADESRLDELLKAVFQKAAWVLKDDDVAQDFVVGVWRALPVDFQPFSLWIRNRLRLYLARSYRAKSLVREDCMAGSEIEHLPLPRQSRQAYLDSVRDPFLRSVANRLLLGFSLGEIARALAMTPCCLRKKLQRVRTRNAPRSATPAPEDAK